MQPIVEHSTVIEASPQEVYRALTSAEGLDAWFTTGAEVDLRPGGRILFRWRDFGADRISAHDGGPILEAKEGRLFSFQWSPAGDDRPTTVRIELEPYGEGTRVHLRESGFPPGDAGVQAALQVGVGWGEALTLLKHHLENGDRYRHPCTWYRVAEGQTIGA